MSHDCGVVRSDIGFGEFPSICVVRVVGVWSVRKRESRVYEGRQLFIMVDKEYLQETDNNSGTGSNLVYPTALCL